MKNDFTPKERERLQNILACNLDQNMVPNMQNYASKEMTESVLRAAKNIKFDQNIINTLGTGSGLTRDEMERLSTVIACNLDIHLIPAMNEYAKKGQVNEVIQMSETIEQDQDLLAKINSMF